MSLELRVLSVNVALPEYAGERNGEPLFSAFRKQPVGAASIEVSELGLAGDGHADLSVHGGPDRAVYAYPADNWSWWETQKGLPCRAGVFGENLTVSGADEDAIRIGDRFRWGPVLLEVSQPRTPCHKFQRFSGREDASAIMSLSGARVGTSGCSRLVRFRSRRERWSKWKRELGRRFVHYIWPPTTESSAVQNGRSLLERLRSRRRGVKSCCPKLEGSCEEIPLFQVLNLQFDTALGSSHLLQEYVCL